MPTTTKATAKPTNGNSAARIPLRLNLGSGTDWMARGILNIDARNLLAPEGVLFIRADISDLSSYFEPGSVDEIHAKDVLEHFPQATSTALLTHWCALLRPGGLLHLKCPELGALARYLLRPDIDDVTKAYRVYGGQDYAENFHKAGFTIPMLRRMLGECGCDVIEAREVEDTNLFIVARKKPSQ
jgi:predicted SAM-dependent methyltransferase